MVPNVQVIVLVSLLLVLIVSFCSVTVAANTFGPEKPIYWRESQAGLKTLPYFCGKAVVDLVRLTLASASFYIGFISSFTSVAAWETTYLAIWMVYANGWIIGWFVSLLVAPDTAGLLGALLGVIM